MMEEEAAAEQAEEETMSELPFLHTHLDTTGGGRHLLQQLAVKQHSCQTNKRE
jgi:hypothetical protein